MPALATEILLLLLLLGANGVFAMAEIAVVSARKARLRQRAEAGDHGARLALDLAESPNRFLSTVQVGITLVGIVAGAFGGTTIARHLTPWIARIPGIGDSANEISLVLVVVAITYLSLVIGELIPKRIGLNNPEAVAIRVARPMMFLSRLVGPLVALLSHSTDGLLRLLGFRARGDVTVNEDEVRTLMQEGVRAGAFNQVESRIVHNALELDLLPVREIMTPRPKVIWLSADDSHEVAWHKIVVSRHSHFPVYAGNRDHPIGVVSVKSIYANLAAGAPVNLRALAEKPVAVPETQTVVQLVETFKQAGRHVALVVDEYGGVVGMVTLHDVMEAIVGEFPGQGERARPCVLPRPDGTWLVDALVDLEAVEAALPGMRFGEEAHRDFQTLAGWLLLKFGHVPREGEACEAGGYVFEVLDMDQHRIDKVLVLERRPAPDEAPPAGTPETPATADPDTPPPPAP